MVNNKVCVVMGGTDAISAVCAKEMAKNGYVTAIIDTDIDVAKKVADEICTFGGLAKAYEAYILDPVSVAGARGVISAEFGRCNVLVNCVSKNNNCEWNMNGLMDALDVFYKDMKGEHGCSIVNICENDGDAVEGDIVALTKVMAVKMAEDGVRVNAVIYKNISACGSHDDLHADVDIEHIPMGRTGKPEEIVGALKYLSDPMAASYTTGNVIYVDGGAYAGLNK